MAANPGHPQKPMQLLHDCQGQDDDGKIAICSGINQFLQKAVAAVRVAHAAQNDSERNEGSDHRANPEEHSFLSATVPKNPECNASKNRNMNYLVTNQIDPFPQRRLLE